jgi:transposase-like protein
MHSSAERFFRKAMNAAHNQSPRVINVDKNAAYPKAIDSLKADKTRPPPSELRPVKYLNNIIELFAPIYKTIGQSREGIRIVQDREASLKGVRNNEYDP